MLDSVVRIFRQPEYLHVLLNPLPIYGLAIAALGLIVALFLRSRRAQMTALILIFLTAASAWPVKYFGEAAYDRVLTLADEDGQAWLAEHQRLGENLCYFYYALALLAAVALVAAKKYPRFATPLVIATLALALCSLGAGGYLGAAGGKIRHREFRTGTPPKKIEARAP